MRRLAALLCLLLLPAAVRAATAVEEGNRTKILHLGNSS